MYDLLPKVKTSKNTEENFDPDKIKESLMVETDLSEEDANEIALELARRAIAYKIKVLTSPEIREMVCAILLEKNYEKSRFMYTRLGLPYYDFEQLVQINKGNQNKPKQQFEDIEKIINRENNREKVYSQMEFEYNEIRKILKNLN